MSIIKDPEYLPVFHHIAKNAGTYVLSWAQMLCRKYHLIRGDNLSLHWTSAKIRRALIRLKDDRQLTIIYCTLTDLTGDLNAIFSVYPELEQFSKDNKRERVLEKQIEYINSKYPSAEDSTTNIIPEDDFLNFIENGDIIPFCVIVDPMEPGWMEARKCIDLIIEKSKRKHALHFTVLRDPYKRAQSLFHYLTSEESAHEPTHDSIQAKNFEDYIQSDEVEDSWFLRSLLNMSDDEVVEPYHLTLADEWLRHFRISDTSKVDDLINQVFHGAYAIQQSDMEDHVIASNLHRNATPNKLKIKLKDLDPMIQQKFLDRTYWDRKLWERYCKNVDIS
jgi:hypothetical protein